MNDIKNETGKDYHISFFRPTTKLARFDRNLSITLLSVWAVCIFGFQIVLRVIEKPVPEQAYVQFENVWDQVQSNQATTVEKQLFVQSALSVLGKVTLQPNDREILNGAVSKITYELVPETKKGVFNQKLLALKSCQYSDTDYQSTKESLGIISASIINVEPHSLEAKLIPVELAAASSSQLDPRGVEKVMAKYLIHNQSVLTDTIFLGFPFHYFYTAVFLLILFVGICLFYCIATDRAMKRLGIEEE